MTSTTNITNVLSGSLRDRMAAVSQSLRTRYENYKVYRETMSELRQLTERDLADLGLHESQVRDVALEAAYGNNRKGFK
ncbi:DUF1127 domain-containing protein [Roseisalinus antarcticus]|uniref:YjiS-like domain-containing protein n=1 Tax=Roseisalinus antarcticus TaxID=254357 RepID=A0A1Y5SW91_9RHOB|nr:DUF1127 domain-containing protein [Roseisalinus antarcticus]SLN48414.1 hypothetical protein ROA7023_02084 [Roseisalinus antarcticus]